MQNERKTEDGIRRPDNELYQVHVEQVDAVGIKADLSQELVPGNFRKVVIEKQDEP
jgi:hypothetical protein